MLVEQLRGRSVKVRFRDPVSDERQERTISSVRPYLFIESSAVGGQPRRWISEEDGYRGVYGEPLTKLFFDLPGDVRQFARDYHGLTWEGNIPWVNRVLADQPEPIPHYRWRKAYLDGEWMVESGEITMLGLFDSYTERMFLWVQKPDEIEPGKHQFIECKNHPEGKSRVTFDTPFMAFKDERSLLEHFVAHLNRLDPDIIVGWALQWADIQQIIKRMRACGLDPATLSPTRRIRYDFGDWDQPIGGRACLDLMTGFEKLWVLKNGQLASKGLGYVAEAALGETKVDLPDGHDTFFTDVGTYLDYNRQDVALLPRLDGLLNVSEHFISLAHAAQIRFQDTPHVTKLATGLFLRDPEFTDRIPSKPQFTKEEYQGADIQEPEPGVYRNVGIADVKAMYHSNAALHNISWDTLHDEGKDCGNGACFRQDRKGLLVRTMDNLTELRNRYKGLMKTDPENRSTWDAMQNAMKHLVASLYGICGDSRYGLYHPQVAAAITFTSRQTLFKLRDVCEELGHTCRYGHTDSVFVDIESPEVGVALMVEVNRRMAPIITEFEKWCESFFISAKNRYAARVTWTDGAFHDPQTYVKGIELIQARMPTVMKNAMKTTLDGMLAGLPQSEVDAQLTGLIDRVLSGTVPPRDVFMRGKLKQNLDAYETLSGPSAGAAWANRHLGKGYRAGSEFMVAIDTQGQYIAFDTVSEIEGIATVDYREMVSRFVVKRVEALYATAGWSPQEVINAMNGVSGCEWL